LTGSRYVEELLSSKNHQRILATFLALRDWCIEHEYLQPTRYVSVEEQLAIFLKIVGENMSNRMAQERFQQSSQRDGRALHGNCQLARRQPAYSSGMRTRESSQIEVVVYLRRVAVSLYSYNMVLLTVLCTPVFTLAGSNSEGSVGTEKVVLPNSLLRCLGASAKISYRVYVSH